MKTTFNNLSTADVFESALRIFYLESEPEDDTLVDILPVNEYEAIFSVQSQNDPMCYEIHDTGFLKLSDDKKSVLIRVNETTADACTAIISDNDIAAIFHY